MKTCGLDVHKDIIFCAIYDVKVSRSEETRHIHARFGGDVRPYQVARGGDGGHGEYGHLHQCHTDGAPVQRDAQRQLHTRRSAGTADGVHPRLPPFRPKTRLRLQL